MKALIQRVRGGRFTIDGKMISSTGRGYVILLGAKKGDTETDARQLAHKTVHLRIFPDRENRMNLSIQDVDGEILVVSQFTLYADTRKGNRPSFLLAGDPRRADELYREYVAALRAAMGEHRVATGRFGATMLLEIANDGPVTIELNTDGC